MNQADIDIIANALQSVIYRPADERTLVEAQDIVAALGYSDIGLEFHDNELVIIGPSLEVAMSIEEALGNR
jgi:hypothetical protein